MQQLKKLIRDNRQELTFVLIFITIFGAAQTSYFLSRHVDFPNRLQRANTKMSAAAINIIKPSEAVTAKGKTLNSSTGYLLEVAWGCEGVEGIFLVIAALIAYQMSIKRKILGILVGTTFLQALNILRIVALYFTVKYQPRLFDLMHVYVGQTFIIFFGVLFFVMWTWFCAAPAQEAIEQSA